MSTTGAFAVDDGHFSPEQILRILRVGLSEEHRWTPSMCNSPNEYNRNLPEWRHQICTWIVEVAQEFRFSIETVAVSVNYFDRLVSAHVIPHTQLQTHALACIYIASKQYLFLSHPLEYPPPFPIHSQQIESRPLCGKHLHIFSEICNASQLHVTEINSLHRLGWDMNVFTSFSFVQHLVQLISEVPSKGVGELALEFCRHALFDYSLAHLPPSQISISALACSCQLLNLDHRPLLEELAAREIVMIEHPEVTEKLFMIRRIFNEQQQARRYEEAALADRSRRSQEHESLVSQSKDGDLQLNSHGVDMDVDLDDSKQIPLSEEHAQRTSTSTQSLVSSREFRTDESGGGNDLDQINEDLEDNDNVNVSSSMSRSV